MRNHHFDCRFCKIAAGFATEQAVDHPFLSDSQSYAIASIGALVEGWSLVIPREHCTSLRDLYSRIHFQLFVRSAVQRVERAYGPSVLFEHGPNFHGSGTGCGTDHAHLHIVPIRFSLLDQLVESERKAWSWVRSSEVAAVTHGREYLFFAESQDDIDPIGLLKPLEKPASQFFRRIIADLVGQREKFDYKTYPFLDISQRSYERLADVA